MPAALRVLASVGNAKEFCVQVQIAVAGNYCTKLLVSDFVTGNNNVYPNADLFSLPNASKDTYVVRIRKAS